MARCISSILGTQANARNQRGESGQVLVMAALLVGVLLGMAAMAIDIGGWASHRTSLQNDADAIVLAAVQELPDETAAHDIADEWAVKNDINPADMTVTITGVVTGGTPKVTVEIAHTHDFSFAPIFGVESAGVSARATATKWSYGGGDGNIVPWALEQAILDSTDNGDLITIKYDSSGGENGNFGALSVDGTGASEYEQSLTLGISSTVCSVNMPSCDSGAETAPECNGALCKPKTGNVTGSTRDGVDYRTSNTDPACDTFDEVFFDTGSSYRLIPQCNPFIEGSLDSMRVIIVPVIDEFGNGSSDVEIQRFALMFLEGYEDGKCSGSSCEVKGRFITNAISIPGLTGEFDPNSSLFVWRLTE